METVTLCTVGIVSRPLPAVRWGFRCVSQLSSAPPTKMGSFRRSMRLFPTAAAFPFCFGGQGNLGQAPNGLRPSGRNVLQMSGAFGSPLALLLPLS